MNIFKKAKPKTSETKSQKLNKNPLPEFKKVRDLILREVQKAEEFLELAKTIVRSNLKQS